MYTTNRMQKTTCIKNNGFIGECIEQKISRIVNNKEPVTDGAPIIFTERKHGVPPEYNIKTDRWEIAVEAQEKLTKYKLAQRQARMDAVKQKDKPSGDTGNPIPGTDTGPKSPDIK